ncbi:MAG: enterotoxin [Phycisphaerales bacterium]
MSARRWKQALVCWLAIVGLSGVETMRAEGSVEYPGPAPGEAQAFIHGDEIVLSNDVITCKWSVKGARLKPVSVTDRQSGTTLSLQDSECFQLILADGLTMKASDLKIKREPIRQSVRPRHPQDRRSGRQVPIYLEAADRSLSVEWRVTLCDGENYVRQLINVVSATPREIVLVDLPAAGARSAGTVDGSPVVVGNMFFAFEHPLSKVRMPDGNNPSLRCSLARTGPIHPSMEQRYSSVTGVAPKGQLRRAFLYYVERERAQPYRPFLHYNSWYDLGYGLGKILEPDALKVIDLFGKELIEQRHVVMDSFVPDDGWDDPASLWRFHEGFPNGFATLQQRAQQYKSGVGAWLSPWGGYGKAKEERMKYGRQEGFETNKTGFSMAGPRYYARFLDACLGMIRDYDLNYFKFDGISDGGTPTGAAAGFESDVEALLRLIDDLRRAKPSLFINVTTGTWSSPYWLWYADSTWRSGADWSTCGWGSKRQQQITYRDAQTWQNVVSRAPLYPINSLMTQGVMFANHGLPDEATGLVEDIHAFFASGTNCQELYITPSLLDAHTWDVLAEAANWARGNADVLVDTHWIGGAPAKRELYGWASWSKRKGILALRNPADGPGRIVVDIGEAFELPEGAARRYSFKSPWKGDVSAGEIRLSAGEDHTFELKPFEVLVFDATPL